MISRVVVLGHGKRVPLKAYMAAVRKAKANPTARFSEGLTCWWPCTGADIVAQWREGVNDRVNQRG